jgi:zinc transport system permease protein
VTWFWGRLAYASFDPELAALSGVRVKALEYGFLALTAGVVVVSVRSVGVVLVSAFVIIPAAAARLVASSFRGTSITALALQLVATLVGLVASYHLDVASGATVVLTLGAAFGLALVLRRG